MAPDSSEDEWEEVEDLHKQETEEDEVKPSDNVEVELDLPDIVKKQQKKKDWEREALETTIRRAAKRFHKETQIALHKVHLLCLLGIGMKLNMVCGSEDLKCRAYSLLPHKFSETKPKDVSVMLLTRLIQSFTEQFKMENGVKNLLGHGLVRFARLESLLKKALEERKLTFKLDLVLIIVMLLRSIGLSTRLVLSLQPISLKVLTEKQKEALAEDKKTNVSKKRPKTSPNRRKRKPQDNGEIPQVDGAGDKSPRVTRSRTRNQAQRNQITSDAPVKKEDAAEASNSAKHTAKRLVKSTRLGGSKRVKITEDNSPLKKELKVVLGRKVVQSDNPNDERVKKELLEVKDVDNVPDKVPPRCAQRKTKRKSSALAKRKMVKSATDNESGDENFRPVKSSDSESDFETEPNKKSMRQSLDVKPSKSKGKNVRSKSASPRQKAAASRSLVKDGNYFDEWLEVYSEQENQWLCIDVFRGAINHPEMMEKYATPPLHYVIAFDNDGAVKDITARYSTKWLTETRKVRVGSVDKDWWKDTLLPYKTSDTDRDDMENKEMQKALLSQPIPTTISAFKDHPLFGLRRHILKYQAVYPPDVPAVGLIRGEEIYPRSAIYTLHTRDKWLQEARCVRDGEEPYKMVASMWINMKLKQDMATLSMPLFGVWQTTPYVPPVAKDGKVPRNQYGNVDLFQQSMMPIGCVQLKLSGLNRVARKLNIDIAQAITGFDSHSGYPHPTTDGYIVCKEHEEVLVAAWREDQIHAAEREREKREQRVYGHWKLLIRGLLAGERVRRKYAKTKDPKGITTISAESGTAWQAKRLEEAKAKGRRGRRRKGADEGSLPFET